MNNGKICISVIAANFADLCNTITAAENDADIIEIRFDGLAPDEVYTSLEGLPDTSKQYLFTYRPRAEGGARDLAFADRVRFWRQVRSMSRFDAHLVDLELDIIAEADFPPERVMASFHDFQGATSARDAVERLKAVPARLRKIAVAAHDITDGIEVFRSIEQGGSFLPIAMGEAGKWTRILALAHESPLTYAAPGRGSETAPGQLTAAELTKLYRVRQLDTSTEVFGVIAGDTTYSLSPYLHNPAFAAEDTNAVFIPLQVADLAAFIHRMVMPGTRDLDLNFRGFAVTNPHKQSIMPYLESIDETARQIGAVNTIKVVDGLLHGFNTDAAGFIAPLAARVGDIAGVRVAVAGAGGAARACVFALAQHRADVTVLARDHAKATALAAEFGVRSASLDIALDDFDVVVNATPLGTKGPHEGQTIARKEQLRGVKHVYDINYNPAETLLIREALDAGCDVIGGLEMLIGQAALQFELWTGRKAPVDVMQASAKSRLGI